METEKVDSIPEFGKPGFYKFTLKSLVTDSENNFNKEDANANDNEKQQFQTIFVDKFRELISDIFNQNKDKDLFKTDLDELLEEYRVKGDTKSIFENSLMEEIEKFKNTSAVVVQPQAAAAPQSMFGRLFSRLRVSSNKSQTPQPGNVKANGGKRKSKKRSTRKPKRRNRRTRSKK